MTADTPDIAKLAAEMRARARSIGKESWSRDSYNSDKVYSGPNLVADPADTYRTRQYTDYLISVCPANVIAILDALAMAEQERDAARETIGQLREALAHFTKWD